MLAIFPEKTMRLFLRTVSEWSWAHLNQDAQKLFDCPRMCFAKEWEKAPRHL